MSVFARLMILVLFSSLRGPVQTGRIIGGRVAKPHSRPYMVLVTKRNETGVIGYCGGFLVDKMFVMTAAHCQAGKHTVQLGIHSVKDGKNLSVAKSFPHFGFDTSCVDDDCCFKNDIMLLKLDTAAELNDKVKTINLADKADITQPSSCSVSGWGITQLKNKEFSDVLKEMNITLNHNSTQRGKDMYCSKGTTGPNKGDSGGPLVCGERAYGVVAFAATKNNTAAYMSCFAKIPMHRDWADGIMGQP